MKVLITILVLRVRSVSSLHFLPSAMAGISTLWVPLLTTLAGIGSLTLLSTAYSTIRFLTLHLITPSHPLQSYKRAGPEPAYALITGSSAGIGFGIARALIQQGFNIILLGHLAGELASAKEQLQTLVPSASIQILAMDARTASPEEMQAAVQSIAHLNVSILVNNVGGNPVTLPPFRVLGNYSSGDVDAVINQNARFMARLTAMMLPILSRRKEEGGKGAERGERSLIINLSSAGRIGLPWLVMYGATKAFNWAFSCGLSRELSVDPGTRHIDCLAILPGDVKSQGNCEGVSANDPRSDEFAEQVVRKVDCAIGRGMKELRPWMMHGVQDWVLGILPEGVKSKELIKVLGKKKDAFNGAWEKSR
jgi:17beta-estradiol 17-dehydrogenase / very-long-chain 3-oxoacyl-CoA reductase